MSKTREENINNVEFSYMISNETETLDEVYLIYGHKEKMPETEECKVIQIKDGNLMTVGIVHIPCKSKTPDRGFLFFCEPCDKLFPQRHLETLINLKKCFNISGVKAHD